MYSVTFKQERRKSALERLIAMVESEIFANKKAKKKENKKNKNIN